MYVKHVWLWILLLALCGCARNALLREEAHVFSQRAAAAAQAGRTFYDDAIATDRELRVALLMLDSACVPPELRATAAAPPACRIGGAEVRLDGVLSEETLAAEYAQLDFLGTYLGALARLTADIESHSGANFKAAKDDLETLIQAFGGDGTGLSGDATAAVADLLDFLNTLAKEDASADEIRRVLREDGGKAHDAMLVLAEALRADAQMRAVGSEAAQATQLVALRNGLLGDATARGQTLQAWYARSDRQRKEQALATRCQHKVADAALREYCGAPAAGLMAAAATTHRELLDLADGRLNARQKARQAHLAYGRFMQAAKLFVKLVTIL